MAALYARLREAFAHDPTPGVGIMLACCGIPARWAGRAKRFQEHTAALRAAWEGLGKPRIMAACSSCLTVLREALPEARAVSVWEVLDGLSENAWAATAPGATGGGRPAGMPAVLSVQDPCTARHDPAWLAAVRSLARKAGVTLEEPRLSGPTTACCGYGGLVWCAQPDTAEAMSAHRAAELPHPGLASCIMCRDRLAASGKECWHLLDLLFPALAGAAGQERGPGLSARRANRAALRRRLLHECLGEEAARPPEGKVRVTPELLARLEARHILLEDVEAAVAGAEASGHCFKNLENGHWLGSWRPRQVTFWVEYTPEGAGFVLHDAWCHRMVVPGSGGQEAAEVINRHQCCTDGSRGEQS